MPDGADARIELLEFKVAHLERALQELSDVLYRQQRELDAWRDRTRELHEQLQQLDDRDGDPSRIEVPPHY
jgi:uncharacterized coiled-coil protein SlyX